MSVTSKQLIFAGLAAAGLATTGYFNLQFVAEVGSFNVARFFADGFASPASSSLSSDTLIAFGAFLVWVPSEARRVGVRHGWVYVLLGFATAFAFALPLFLLVRDRKLSEIEMATA